ncbi:MAG: SUMF1/EgtB/PvdO family nonheme iron enzyme [Xanthomonadales bacterium]|nr:SUMF1/EgtB/PvdO family nonheme iron enzyme [Xanthomonadales bacterium]
MPSFFKGSITFLICQLTLGLLVSTAIWAQEETEPPAELNDAVAETIPEEAIVELIDDTVADEIATEEVATDEAATDEASADEATTDEATTDEATTDEVNTTEAEESIEAIAEELPLDEPPTIEGAKIVIDESGEDISAEAAAEEVPAVTVETRRSVNRLGIDTSDEFDLDMSAPIMMAPAIAPPEVTLPDAQQDAELQDALVRLALDPTDTEALVIRNTILANVINQANAAVEGNELGLAWRMESAVRTVDDEQAGLQALVAAILAKTSHNSSVTAAAANITAGQYFEPEGDNAFARYNEMLNENSQDQVATAGMNSLLLAVIATSDTSAAAGNYEQALELLDQASVIPLSSAQLSQARIDINAILASSIADKQRNLVALIDAGNFAAADTQLAELVALGANPDEVSRLRQSLADARVYGSFFPGQQIQDSFTGVLPGQTPIMVVIPAGNFLMGSDTSVKGSSNSERPVHLITFARGFAMAQHEITVGEFMLFANDTQFLSDAERLGKSRVYDEDNGTIAEKEDVNWRHDFYGEVADLKLPVIHVSWADTSAYTAWLSENTNRTYRLPSEAEFEYSLRAGTLTDYWWGEDTPEEVVTNITGVRDKSASGRRWTDGFKRYKDGYWGPAPVASFVPNAFGLYDMGGNVSEWVEDCWHSSYVQAPTDGSAWVNPGCTRRVLRGASWSSAPEQARSASRISAASSSRFSRVGFRVVRDL